MSHENIRCPNCTKFILSNRGPWTSEEFFGMFQCGHLLDHRILVCIPGGIALIPQIPSCSAILAHMLHLWTCINIVRTKSKGMLLLRMDHRSVVQKSMPKKHVFFFCWSALICLVYEYNHLYIYICIYIYTYI